eukprot:4509864-Prymnesium_polylepis.1
MAVELRITFNVLGVGCVPYRHGMIDTPGQPRREETGREHGTRCDQREGGCTGGPCPPVVDQN